MIDPGGDKCMNKSFKVAGGYEFADFGDVGKATKFGVLLPLYSIYSTVVMLKSASNLQSF